MHLHQSRFYLLLSLDCAIMIPPLQIYLERMEGRSVICIVDGFPRIYYVSFLFEIESIRLVHQNQQYIIERQNGKLEFNRVYLQAGIQNNKRKNPMEEFIYMLFPFHSGAIITPYNFRSVVALSKFYFFIILLNPRTENHMQKGLIQVNFSFTLSILL